MWLRDIQQQPLNCEPWKKEKQYKNVQRLIWTLFTWMVRESLALVIKMVMEKGTIIMRTVQVTSGSHIDYRSFWIIDYWLLNEEKKRKLLSGKKPSLLSTSIPFYRIAKMIVSLYTFYENVCKFLHKVNFWRMCKVMLNAHLIPSQSMSQINWFYKMFIDKDCSLAFNWIKNRLHHEIWDVHSNPIECNKNVATN